MDTTANNMVLFSRLVHKKLVVIDYWPDKHSPVILVTGCGQKMRDKKTPYGI